MTIQIKAIEQYFRVVLFIMLYKVTEQYFHVVRLIELCNFEVSD